MACNQVFSHRQPLPTMMRAATMMRADWLNASEEKQPQHHDNDKHHQCQLQLGFTDSSYYS